MKLDTFTRIIKDESGATAIEYGLILAFMAGAIIAVFSGLGTQLARSIRRETTCVEC